MKNTFRTRKERMEFLVKKLGTGIAKGMCYLTDAEVKRYFDIVYPKYKDKPDFKEEPGICKRCGDEILWHTYCGCGDDRAIFDDESWIEDIMSNSEHFDIDYIFAKEHGIEIDEPL